MPLALPPSPAAAAAKVITFLFAQLEPRQRFEKQRAARRCGAAGKSAEDKVTRNNTNPFFFSFRGVHVASTPVSRSGLGEPGEEICSPVSYLWQAGIDNVKNNSYQSIFSDTC